MMQFGHRRSRVFMYSRKNTYILDVLYSCLLLSPPFLASDDILVDVT